MDAYDEWDHVAQALYACLVSEPIRWALPVAERDRFALPPYDLLLERYAMPTRIEVVVPGKSGLRIFHALTTRDEAFDQCQCRLIDNDGFPASHDTESHPVEAVRFRARHQTEDGRIVLIENVEVEGL